jgi:hypothetical protein
LVKAPVVLLGALKDTVPLDGAPFKPVPQSATQAHAALGVRLKLSARIEASQGLFIILTALRNQPAKPDKSTWMDPVVSMNIRKDKNENISVRFLLPKSGSRI